MPIVLNPTVANPGPVTTATSSDGKLTASLDDAHGGVLLRADFSALGTKPIKVRFLRGTTRVRSGDPAWSPGGIAYAYDHEAPLGASAAWTAVPLFADGTEGSPTTSASLSTSSLDADNFDFWIKSTTDPGLSVLASAQGTGISRGRVGRLNLTDIPGSPYPVAAYNPRGYKDMQITFLTTTYDQRDALEACIDSGVVLVQCNPTYGINDFYALGSDADEDPLVFQFAPSRLMAITFVLQKRPPTVDSPFYFPGHSYADQLDSAPTYTDRLATWPLYQDALTVSSYALDSLLFESGGADDEGSP